MSLTEKVVEKAVEKAIEQGWFDQLTDLFKTKHHLLVLGSTGNGKTNLVRSLTDISTTAIHYMNRTKFHDKIRIKIENTPFIVFDTPGQDLHQSLRMEGIKEAMSGKGVSCLLNVVSFGYHEYRDGKGRAITPEGEVRESFLTEHRTIEIDALHEINLLFSQEPLITVVTKADLWWDQKGAILNYYERGPYAQALNPALKARHNVLAHSSVSHRFYGIGKISSSFDNSDKLNVRSDLFETLLSAIR